MSDELKALKDETESLKVMLKNTAAEKIAAEIKYRSRILLMEEELLSIRKENEKLKKDISICEKGILEDIAA